MERERYQLIKRIFVEASGLEGIARDDLVAARCAGDEELLRQVGQLLAGTQVWATRTLRQAPAAEVEQLPRPFGPYVLERVLGRGGMGIVYGARDERLGREVALKILVTGAADGNDSHETLRAEARLLAALNHPHIATIHSLEEIDGSMCATLELVDGMSLAERLAEGPLPADECLRIGHQLCEALAAAHERGIVHLDLKPANVMLTADGRVKVLDFGIARSLNRGEIGGATAIGGTPGYMSPEQMLGQEIDERTDLWALGCVLFESLSGVPAIAGNTIDALVEATLRGEPSWGDLPPSTPEGLRALVGRCLTRAREERPTSARVVHRQIEAQIARGLADEPDGAEDDWAGGAGKLPRTRTTLIGRAQLVEQVGAEFARSSRLVSLIGAGGSGKTRVAIEAARTRPGAAFWVELAPLAEEDRLVPHLAGLLGVRATAGEQEEVVLAELDGSRLLVLDNCEHIIEEVARFVDVALTRCPDLTVLVTSREELALEGEVRVPVLPLETEITGAVEDCPGVQLFAHRAAQHGFELNDENAADVVAVVRRLEGVPLAIELAAGRMRMLSLPELRSRLEESFRVLAGGGRLDPGRHQTVRATIDWSHRLLAPDEQVLLRRLAVFADGWTLRAAESVCSGDGIESWEVLDLLASLVAKSLVSLCSVDIAGQEEIRYRLLETIREYGWERLVEAGEEMSLKDLLLESCREMAREARPQLFGPRQREWLDRLEAESANFEVAFAHCMRPDGDTGAGLALGYDLNAYWRMRTHHARGIAVMNVLLARAGAEFGAGLRARAHCARGYMLGEIGDHEPALRDHAAAVDLFDAAGEAYPRTVAMLQHAGQLHYLGHHERARTAFVSAADEFRLSGMNSPLASTLLNLANVHRDAGDAEEGLACYREALQLFQELGNVSAVADCTERLGTLLVDLGNDAEAATHYERALEEFRELGDRRAIARIQTNLSGIVARVDSARGQQMLRDSLQIWREVGDSQGCGFALCSLANLCARSGELDEAESLLREAVSLAPRMQGLRLGLHGIEAGATLAQARGDPLHAALLLGAANALRLRHQMPRPPAGASASEEQLAAILEHAGASAAMERGALLDLAEALAVVV